MYHKHEHLGICKINVMQDTNVKPSGYQREAHWMQCSNKTRIQMTAYNSQSYEEKLFLRHLPAWWPKLITLPN